MSDLALPLQQTPPTTPGSTGSARTGSDDGSSPAATPSSVEAGWDAPGASLLPGTGGQVFPEQVFGEDVVRNAQAPSEFDVVLDKKRPAASSGLCAGRRRAGLALGGLVLGTVALVLLVVGIQHAGPSPATQPPCSKPPASPPR